ncbi:MAG: exodeoxyribonuclease VII large subunit [Lentisphaeria bacterium]|nr:exodeoxyribonuclease VII large subunit [Lentisphaeria bacterium]
MPDANIPVWSVSDLNSAIRDLLENTFLPVRVMGEISGITIHRSGHVYLTLKDEHAQIKAVYFSGAQKCLDAGIENGMKVEAHGKISFYAQRGECQLSLRELLPVGTGTLQQRFEEMKKRLYEEGLFDQERKKPLPFIPRCIGIITSPEGAAIQDFIRVALDRFPPLRIRIFPAAVQGKGAERYLAQGVEFFNKVKPVDVILLTRGGGSIEDLWPFNEEILARAIAASEKPVVSAVGHEIDISISDLAADLRAPTPTAAAEMLLPDLSALKREIMTGENRLCNAIAYAAERASSRLQTALSARALTKPVQLIMERTQTVDLLVRDMELSLQQAFQNARTDLDHKIDSLKKLNPESILNRGYSILLRKDGKAVRSPKDAPKDTLLEAKLAKGSLKLRVE